MHDMNFPLLWHVVSWCVMPINVMNHVVPSKPCCSFMSAKIVQCCHSWLMHLMPRLRHHVWKIAKGFTRCMFFFWIIIYLWCLVLVCPRTCLLSPFPRFSQSMHQSMHQCLFQDSKHPACSPEPDLASLILRLWRFCQSKFLLFIVRPSPVCDVWEHMRTIMEKTWMNQLSSLTMSMVRFECRTWPMSCLVIWL